MIDKSTSFFLGESKLSLHFTVVFILFLAVLLGIVGYTIVTINEQKSMARLIDLGGRQRMLVQRHFAEVHLTSQGVAADYQSTRELILSTLQAFLEGGEVVVDSKTGQRESIPLVLTEDILAKLREQYQQFNQVILLSDDFLKETSVRPGPSGKLQILWDRHASLIHTADEAVKKLNAFSEGTLENMVRWESIMALFVGVLGIIVTGQGIRYGHKLENEIADRKRAELALRTSERFVSSIVENIPHMVFVKSATDLRIVRLNKACEAFLQCSRSEVLGRTDYDLFPKDQADFFTAKDREVLASGKLMDIGKEPILTKSQSLRYLHTKKIPLFDEEDRPEYLLGISEDITERLKSQDSLQRSEERYRALYEDNPSMYFTVREDGTILSVNRFGAQQLGYEVEELTGRSVIEVFHEEDKPRVREHFSACLQSQGTLSHWQLRKRRKDGSELWVREVARAIQQEDGQRVVLVVCEDITEQKQAEARLRESEVNRNEALRQSEALKSALLSSVSHELRTPLTSMKMSVSNILENIPSGMDSVQQEFLKVVDQEIIYMSRLVDNLLDMSQIEAGTLKPRREWYPLEDLIEGALRRTELTYGTRNIEINLPEDLTPVFVDGVQIQQVLVNLLDNAVKYSEPDSVIGIHVRGGVNEIEVEVANKGGSLSTEDQARIFERFYRGPARKEQSIRGTGLGLAICKGLVEAHGGRVWVQSLNNMVNVTFTIPVEKAS